MNNEHWKKLLPIITAFAEGEEIQGQLESGAWIDLKGPSFGDPVETYRIKPKATRVPLEFDDIPPGSAIRCGDSPHWAMVVAADVNVITFARTLFDTTDKVSYQEARECGWQIKRPGQDWEPMSKEVVK